MDKQAERELIERMSAGVVVNMVETGVAAFGFSPHIRDIGALRQPTSLHMTYKEVVSSLFARKVSPQTEAHNRMRSQLKQARIERLRAQLEAGATTKQLGLQEGCSARRIRELLREGK